MNEQRIEEQQKVSTGPPEEAPLAVPKVDLNTASADELVQLPGIGPKMAKRIVEYRETVRPFEEPEEIMAVPGIGRETYRRLAERLTVSPVAQPPAEEIKPQPTDEEGRLPVEGEEPPPLTELEPPVKEERAEAEGPPPREPPPPREVPPEVRPPAVAPPPAPSAWRGGFTWLAAASLIGAVMGAILALLVIGGINGTLDLNQRTAVVELRANADQLSREAEALQTDLEGLRQRLDALEGLTGRLNDVERDIEDLDSGLAEAQADIVALDARADALGKDIATVRAAADRFNAFLDGLRDLLFEFQGAPPTPTPTATSTATPRPRPGQLARRVRRLHLASKEGSPMAMNTETKQPSFWNRLGQAIARFWAVLLRLIFVFVIAILIGMGIYYGVPWVYWRLVIPVQDSAARVEMLQRNLENTRANWNTDLTEQGQRISALESDLAAQRERIAALEVDMVRMDELLTAQGETLSELRIALGSAEEATGQLGDDVEVLYGELDTLRGEMADPNRVVAAFERRLILLQAWGEILKVRMHLLEDNAGNARQALALARANLERVIVLSPEPEAEALIAIQERLDAADTAIEERPFVAINELEIIWRDLDTFITSEQK